MRKLLLINALNSDKIGVPNYMQGLKIQMSFNVHTLYITEEQSHSNKPKNKLVIWSKIKISNSLFNGDTLTLLNCWFYEKVYNMENRQMTFIKAA